MSHFGINNRKRMKVGTAKANKIERKQYEFCICVDTGVIAVTSSRYESDDDRLYFYDTNGDVIAEFSEWKWVVRKDTLLTPITA